MADGTAGLARYHDDGFVAVPLGLVALTWIRLFKPLLSERLPQNPSNIGMARLGFVKRAFRRLADESNLDRRVGTMFSGGLSADLHQALKDAAATIEKMPANYVTYQNGGQVFPVARSSRVSRPTAITLDREYLYIYESPPVCKSNARSGRVGCSHLSDLFARDRSPSGPDGIRAGVSLSAYRPFHNAINRWCNDQALYSFRFSHRQVCLFCHHDESLSSNLGG